MLNSLTEVMSEMGVLEIKDAPEFASSGCGACSCTCKTAE